MHGDLTHTQKAFQFTSEYLVCVRLWSGRRVCERVQFPRAWVLLI